MRIGVLAISAIFALTGCSNVFQNKTKTPPPAPSSAAVSVPAAVASKPPKNARTVDQFDTTSAAEKQAAAAAPASRSERQLGTTIASLGDPTDPGFWAETPLVQTAQSGRLSYPGSGKSVQVELRPSGGPSGSGTRVSLPAFRVLDAPLTGLPELVVYAGPTG